MLLCREDSRLGEPDPLMLTLRLVKDAIDFGRVLTHTNHESAHIEITNVHTFTLASHTHSSLITHISAKRHPPVRARSSHRSEAIPFRICLSSAFSSPRWACCSQGISADDERRHEPADALRDFGSPLDPCQSAIPVL